MIAAGTNTRIAYFEGEPGADVDALDRALADKQSLMPPVVLTELLSDPELDPAGAEALCGVPLIETHQGYWQRAGELRAKVLARGRKARLGDVLIAQSCIDNGVALLTRDRDFRACIASGSLDLLAT